MDFEYSSSGLYPSTNLTWVTLPGDKSPVRTALRVIETRKPNYRGKVVLPSGKLFKPTLFNCRLEITVITVFSVILFGSDATDTKNMVLFVISDSKSIRNVTFFFVFRKFSF